MTWLDNVLMWKVCGEWVSISPPSPLWMGVRLSALFQPCLERSSALPWKMAGQCWMLKSNSCRNIDHLVRKSFESLRASFCQSKVVYRRLSIELFLVDPSSLQLWEEELPPQTVWQGGIVTRSCIMAKEWLASTVPNPGLYGREWHEITS